MLEVPSASRTKANRGASDGGEVPSAGSASMEARTMRSVGVMLWGRFGERWIANPSAREALRQLVETVTHARGCRRVRPRPLLRLRCAVTFVNSEIAA